ncbi:MMPL family transporter [Reyranella sp.]|uniref:MMPL family transporter n=1 Tax=Reyranella sp. TaxID=1929291 RepID=UPI003BAB26CE
MIGWFIGRLVAACVRHRLVVLLLGLLATAGSAVYAAGHFAMTTDVTELITEDQDWRQRELAYEKAFPTLQLVSIVVVDGATPEVAEAAATRLAAALAAQPQRFSSVQRPDGGTFFEKNGLLFLPVDQVRSTVEGLMRAQFFLGALAADPSLRGLLTGLQAGLEGVRRGQASLADMVPVMSALDGTVDAALAGRMATFSLQPLIGGGPTLSQPTRRVIVVKPVLDYTELQPGAKASEAVRATARELGLDADHGVTVRLTGPVPLGDEEFASLAKDGHLLALAMVAALVGILWLAVRSVRVEAAILVTTIIGLVITTAFGLYATGRLNVISVAFIPLFVGLGIDFSIQYSVRFLAERRFHDELRDALTAAGAGVGRPLALAAASIGVGFLAFLPTSYLGVAELGVIAGIGMGIAFVLSVTFLPALLAVVRPRSRGMAEMGYPWLAPVEASLAHHRRIVLGIGLLLAVGSAALLPFVRFDFDPLHLKSPEVESMSTLQALTTDPDWTPNTIAVLAPSLGAAPALAEKLAALPEVARAVTLQSFVPADQAPKLALIGAAAARLGPMLDRPPAPAPGDAELGAAITATAQALRSVAPAETATEPAVMARRLADDLEKLALAAPEVRAAVAAAVATPIAVTLRRVRALLQAGPVAIDTLPPDIVHAWLAADGRARIQLFPHPGKEDEGSLLRFSRAVQSVYPDATGVPISIRAAGGTILTSFLQAGAYAALAIIVILAVTLRRVRDVVLTMLPVVLSGLLTFATCALLDLPLNFANIIALPLLFGVGVAFNIYFVMAWRAGETAPLQSSLMRAVVFSALTTATAFGALWLSSHPGTASMGRLLMISLGWELLVTLLFRPALLARPPAELAR